MPRYFFNLYNDEVTRDREGSFFPDGDAARHRAMHEARVLAADSVREHGHLVRSHHIQILDDSGAEIASIRFGDVVSIRD